MVQGMSRCAWNEFSQIILVRCVLSYLCGTFYLDPSASVKKIFAFSLGGLFGLSKELRELIPHIGPLAIVIPPKIFLERVGFPADNISSRVAWKFRGGIKVQTHVGRARVAMNAKQERIKRVYPLLMGNDNRFVRVFSLFEHVSFSRHEPQGPEEFRVNK